jgi:phosphatidylglycerophosphate synthase
MTELIRPGFPAREARYQTVVARLALAQKSNRGAPGYSRWINRRLGRYIAAWAYLRGLTPNQVTAISACMTFGAIAALGLIRPSLPLAVTVVILLLAGYAFDSADGQLARLRGGGTPGGEFLDHVVDSVKASAVHLAILVGWFRYYDLGHAGYLLIPMCFTLVSAVFFFSVILSEQLRRGRAGEGAKEHAPVLRSVLVLPWDYGVLCLTLLFWPVHAAFGVLYSGLLVANVVLLAVALRSWFGELTRVGAAR